MLTFEQYEELVIATEKGWKGSQLKTDYITLRDAANLPIEDKTIWVGALRSDSYTQGDYMLKAKHKDKEEYLYCCLGVYAETISVPRGNATYETGYFQFSYQDEDCYYKHAIYLPEEIIPKNVQAVFSRLNDNDVPFPVIATIIEEML